MAELGERGPENPFFLWQHGETVENSFYSRNCLRPAGVEPLRGQPGLTETFFDVGQAPCGKGFP